MKPKNELLRVVKSPSTEISVDSNGKMPGRGAYICRDNNCFIKIIKTNALSRAFKTKISEDITQELQKQLENLNG